MSVSSIAKIDDPGLRPLESHEAVPRGCKYCAYVVLPERDTKEKARFYREGKIPPKWLCPFKKCPFKELDGRDFETDCKAFEAKFAAMLAGTPVTNERRIG